jgi:hypothetical protein
VEAVRCLMSKMPFPALRASIDLLTPFWDDP